METSQVLDLCVRKRPPSPDSCPSAKRAIVYVDSASCQYSPVSNSDSDTSDASVKRPCRPFKAYIKDPLTLAQGLVSTETLLYKDSSEAFSEFRSKILSQVRTGDTGTNKNMRRNNVNQTRVEDPSYWEKRRKNNEAAKRSRDARRAKEDEIAIRCAFLERENCHLKYLTDNLKKELEKLQKIVYLREFHV